MRASNPIDLIPNARAFAAGTGRVTVTVPDECGTGLAGQARFVVDLGPSQSTDEAAGPGSSRAYGTTVSVALEPLP